MKYEIKGSPFPVVICTLEENEPICCQQGAMAWMSPNMKMSTNAGGSVKKAFTRVISGESMFQNKYIAEGGAGEIAFAVSMPGNIVPIQISATNSIIAQKTAYLASEENVNFTITFQKKFGVGFFGGEGFIMQKFTGNGMLFLEFDGSIVEYDLMKGQSILIDATYLAAMESTCTMSIEKVSGVGNVLFGGEGFFNTRVTGPGHVWLQTMPLYNLAGAIRPYIPTSGS